MSSIPLKVVPFLGSKSYLSTFTKNQFILNTFSSWVESLNLCSFNIGPLRHLPLCENPIVPPGIADSTLKAWASKGINIRYSGSVSLRYWHFLLDRGIGLTRQIQIQYCVIVKPHKSHKHIIKHHNVSVHYISSVLKLSHSLIFGTDEYLSQIHVNTSLRHPPFSFQTACRFRLLESRRYNSLHCSYYT